MRKCRLACQQEPSVVLMSARRFALEPIPFHTTKEAANGLICQDRFVS